MKRGLLWLGACALLPGGTFGSSGATVSPTTQARRHDLPAFGRCGACTRHVSADSAKRQCRRDCQRLPGADCRRRFAGVTLEASLVSGGGEPSDASSTPQAAREEKFTKVPPGAQAPVGAEKHDEAAITYADAGDWTKALQLIKAMRDNNHVPSVTAYVATIEACRRAHLFSYAGALLCDMHKVCMPEDLFAQYAASHPNEPGVTQTQRVFALLLMMREDHVNPLEETYRSIMGLCTKEGLWQLSLLLLQHLRQNGLVPGKFVWDEICTVLFKNGHAEMATMIYETAEGEFNSGERKFGASSGTLDLHSFTASTALALVRIVLLDMVRKPKNREYHDAAKKLKIITGMGNNSKDGEAVIKPQVMDMLTAMGLEPKMMRNNEGCIVLKPESLQAYITRSPQQPEQEEISL